MVVTLWKQIEKWLQNKVEAGTKLDDIDTIFGRNVSEKNHKQNHTLCKNYHLQ